jgi:Protein tyrosine/serine phosphatase
MRKLSSVILLLVVLLPLSAQTRNEKWAKSVKSDYVENFFQIDDEFFRSANLSNNAFKELESLEIMEVINLRSYHSDIRESKGTNVKLYRVKMDAHHIREKDVIEVLRIINKREGKILVHCKHGSDRTGLIVAMYRIIFQDWSKEDATNELVNGGYGYHTIFSNIPKFIENANIDRIKKAVLE